MRKEKGSASDILGRYETTIRLQKAVIFCLVFAVIVIAAICMYLGSLPKSVPWVIELTPEGEATYYPDAVKLLEDWTPNDASQRFFMLKYVRDLRGVSTDNYRNQEAAGDVFSCSLENASRLINTWYQENNPIVRSADEYVIIPEEEMSIVQYSPTQWRVSWRETTYRRQDRRVIRDEQYEGIFTVAFYTPDTERRKIENPIGLYVTNFDISLLRDLM